MVNRLEPLNVEDFTGGLNLRRNAFQLAENESPEMLNIEVDPRGGFYSRRGWQRWVNSPIVEGTWDPRNAFMHMLADGDNVIYLVNEGVIHTAVDNPPFTQVVGVDVSASPHGADFVSWGDTLYVACGKGKQSAKRIGTGTMTLLPLATTGSWHDDYTDPTGNTLPSAEFFEAHAGFMFAANIDESGLDYPTRVRWSHSNNPEDWATDDYIDMDPGGSRITALQSFNDHLLIFKERSVWALYGYDAESFQLIEVSSVVGCPSPQAVCKSERSVFFYSPHVSPGVYGYQGETPIEISEPLRRPFEEINRPDQVWVGWVQHRLWVTVPWDYGGPLNDARSVFVFDPSIADGAWVMHQSLLCTPGPYISIQGSLLNPIAAVRSDECHVVVELEAIEEGYDLIDFEMVLGTVGGDEIVTLAGDMITLLGTDKTVPTTVYRTPWLDAGWPTRKKSWRRPDYICREFGGDYDLDVSSYRDHEETRIRRRTTLKVQGGAAGSVWGQFKWGDGTQWAAGETSSRIERGGSFGLAKSLQLRIVGPKQRPNRWGIDAIIMKIVHRRFR